MPRILSRHKARREKGFTRQRSNPGALQSGRRYEYDGLNLLRVDELYDSNSNGLTDDDAWRRLEVNTYGPGTLGALIGKRVYTHTNNDATPDATNDFTYTYDAVGNVIAVYNANSTNRGNELYYFSQDAFGNELSNDGNLPTWQRVNLLGGSQWTTARTAGITEHHTGKWIDPFTGLYYFHARWLDASVGRFVGRDPAKRDSIQDRHPSSCCGREFKTHPAAPIPLRKPCVLHPYSMGFNSPTQYADFTGISATQVSDLMGRNNLSIEGRCEEARERLERILGKTFCLRKCRDYCITMTGDPLVGLFYSQCLQYCDNCMKCAQGLLDFAKCLAEARGDTEESAKCLAQLAIDCKDYGK